jgi:hypothetical protein
MSSRTIFFSRRNRRDRSPLGVAHVASKGSRWKGTMSPSFFLFAVPSLRFFFGEATCPTVFGSRVTKDAEIQKSRRAPGPEEREDPWGCARDREWPRGESHLLALPRDGPSSSEPFLPRVRLFSPRLRIHRGP